MVEVVVDKCFTAKRLKEHIKVELDIMKVQKLSEFSLQLTAYLGKELKVRLW